MLAEKKRILPDRFSAADRVLLVAALAAVALVTSAWLHASCHPSGDMWLSFSGRPEDYCDRMAGDNSAWITFAAVTVPAGALVAAARGRARLTVAIVAAGLLLSIANLVAFWVIYAQG